MLLKNLLKYKYILVILIILLSFIRINFNKKSIYDINETNFIGVIDSYEYKDTYITFILKGKEKIKCNYYLNDKESINIHYGDKIYLTGTLKEPKNNTIPNTFNYRKYLNNNNINYILNVDKINKIIPTHNIIYKIKNIIQKRLDKYDKTGYLNAFIIGNKNNIDDNTYNNYSKNGIIHIFSISGMHISLLATIILSILNKFKKSDKNILIVIIFLLFYLILTNYQASITRSIIFFTLLNLFKLKKINISTKDTLLLAICIILIIKPKFILNTGFQYSSIISYSLIYFSNYFNKNYILNILLVSLVSFLISLPITINMNYTVNILSIFINIIFVPLVSFILYPLSLITFIFPFIHNIFDTLIKLTELISNSISNINIFILPIPKFNIITIFLYYLIVYLSLSKNKKYFFLLIFYIVLIKNINKINPNYNIYYLDVGQGDMSVIKYKDECIVIDTGPEPYNSTYQITDNHIKFLYSIGVNDIDLLVITHGDTDHIGNAKYLIDNFKVKNVMLNNGTLNEKESELPKEKIIKKYKGKMKFYTLIQDNCKMDDENCNSIVNYLIANNKKLLFMGDAGVETENNIISKYNINNIDFIKIGHHGSDTSSGENFINTITPKNSIISVGENNRYGHPKDSVLKTLTNSKIYRTDQNGSIEVIINNKGYNIKTYNP